MNNLYRDIIGVNLGYCVWYTILRYDKEINLREKCRKIEENNKKGRTRDVYKEVKYITGSYTSRSGEL